MFHSTVNHYSLKLKLTQYPAMNTNRMLYTTAPLYNIIIIFEIVQSRSEILNTKNDEFVSVAISRLSQHHQGFCTARLHTSTVGNVKVARFERSYYCYIHMPTFRIVWLLRNLSFGGNLYLLHDKNTAFV